MSSIIQGYNYDIFISYRQKDNKHDGWVTDFVNNLRGELESAFKEEIQVYFDINPHDGLLETHDVNESLKEKLKCLIFIPIISRTYCDPKSFAWEHEFMAFLDMASMDEFGLKVKLSNGNVGSRVLPVRIHDLDEDDLRLCESLLGTKLRSIDFVYKSPGVNRPLLMHESKPHENLNHVEYRDQINKVSNSVLEIINSMKRPVEIRRKSTSNESGTKNREKKIKPIFISGSLFLSALIIVLYLVYSSVKPKIPEKSIAVLPFENLSGDPGQEIICSGLADEIIMHLFKIRSFDRVVPLGSVLHYQKANKKFDQIASELNVNYILWGTYRKNGERIKVIVQLVDPQKDSYVWVKEYEENYSATDIILIQSDIALRIASGLEAGVTDAESRYILEKGTTNQEAYELVQQAKYLWNHYSTSNDSLSKFISLAKEAIKLDTNYADAYAWAGIATLITGRFSGTIDMRSVIWDAKSLFTKALGISQSNGLAHLGLAAFNEFTLWDYIQAEKEYQKSIELLPNDPFGILMYSEFLIRRDRRKDSRSWLLKYEKIEGSINGRMMLRSGLLSFRRSQSHKSINTFRRSNGLREYEYIGENFIWLNEYDSALYYYKMAIDSGDKEVKAPRFMSGLALAAHQTGNIKWAHQTINKIIEDCSISPAGNPEYFIGWYYAGTGDADSSILWLEKAFSKRSPEISWLKADPVLASLKNFERYKDLYNKTGHRDYDEYIGKRQKKIAIR